MATPPLLKLEGIRDYKEHYQQHYCRGVITTADSIRVYFQPQKFGHAFYENSQRKKALKMNFQNSVQNEWTGLKQR